MKYTHIEECRDCKGTGLYVGMAERDGSAVVCFRCKGTGYFEFSHEWEPFIERKPNMGVLRVLQTNPGVCVGTGNGHRLEEFGGMTRREWESGAKFIQGTEMRGFTCPAWWYQSADYSRKPSWKECGWGQFSQCQHFVNKAECWKRFDAEGK